MDHILAIVLLVASMGFVLLEVFVPSMGLLVVFSLASLAGSMIFAFRTGTAFGLCLAGVAVVGIPAVLVFGVKVFPRTRLGKHMILSGPPPGGSSLPENHLAPLLGQEGVSLTRLRPSGAAEITGRRVDVLARGEMIEAGVRIVVIDCSGNRILVRAATPPVGPEEV